VKLIRETVHGQVCILAINIEHRSATGHPFIPCPSFGWRSVCPSELSLHLDSSFLKTRDLSS